MGKEDAPVVGSGAGDAGDARRRLHILSLPQKQNRKDQIDFLLLVDDYNRLHWSVYRKTTKQRASFNLRF